MKKNILIIDDNPRNNSDYITALRSKNKYNVEVCMRLSAALRLLQSRHYDLVVIDMMMPIQGLRIHNEMTTGIVFYNQKLKSLKNQQDIFFLFWSQLEMGSFNNLFGDDIPSNVGFLHKEVIDVEHLYKKIETILD